MNRVLALAVIALALSGCICTHNASPAKILADGTVIANPDYEASKTCEAWAPSPAPATRLQTTCTRIGQTHYCN